MFDQDASAMSEGEEAEEPEREQEKLGVQGGKKAGPLRRGATGGAAEGERRVLEGLRRLWRQEYIGAVSVHSYAGGA